jgi:hypothetical protein
VTYSELHQRQKSTIPRWPQPLWFNDYKVKKPANGSAEF